MNYIFDNCHLLTSINLSNFDTSSVTSMEYMFNGCFSLRELNISNFDLKSVKSMQFFLSECKAITSIILPKLNNETPVINLSYMFHECSALKNIDLSNFDTQNVVYMDHMFSECISLTELNLNNIKTSSAINIEYMFSGCFSLTSLNLSNFNTSKVKYMNGLFYGCSKIARLDLSNFNTSKTENMAFMFYKMKSLIHINIFNFDTSNVMLMHYMFYGCESLMTLDLSKFNTKKIINMDSMFSDCTNLKELKLNNFDTRSVTSMQSLFNGCKSLIDLDLKEFNTSLVISFDFMFADCVSLEKLEIQNFITSSANSMKYLFKNCNSLTNLEISNFDTSSVTNMIYMFSHCKKLVSINLNKFNTSSVKYMDYMFEDCFSLINLEIDNFNTSSVISMSHMFDGCNSLTYLNLSNFITNNLENMDYTFANNNQLAYLNLFNMNENNIKSMNNIFYKTQDNMVFCINKTNAVNINKLIIDKGCSVVDCSLNWKESRKLIYERTNECIEGTCDSIKKYFYDYKCYDICPINTHSYKYICGTKDKYIEHNTLCSIKQHFLKSDCNKNLNNDESKRKFIERTMKSLLSQELYDFVLLAIHDKKIFTIRTDKEVYQIYALSNKNREKNLTYIDFTECIKKLRKRHDLRQDDDVIIFKVEYYSSDFKIPIIEYILFNSGKSQKISLLSCQNIKIKYYVPLEISDFEDYKYNPLNKYYQDKCFPNTKNKADILLYDRRKEFDKNNMSLCESICEFKGYKNNIIECECEVKTKFNTYFLDNFDKYNLIHRFNDTLQDFSLNIWVVKCFSYIFNKKNLLSNLVSKLYKLFIIANTYSDSIDKSNEKKTNKKKEECENKYEHSEIKDNNMNINIINFNLDVTKENSRKINSVNKIILNSACSTKSLLRYYNSRNPKSNIDSEGEFKPIFRKQKIKNNLKDKKFINEYLIKTDNELNFFKYNKAIKYDHRTFCQYYISLLRTKQLLVFAFNTKNDYNPQTIKICFFFFMLILVLIIDILFIDEMTIHHIYINKGKFDFLLVFTRYIYSTIISYIIKLILISVISTENIFLFAKKGKVIEKKQLITLGLKYNTFYPLGIIMFIIFWIYIICFFGIFSKTYGLSFEIFGISFALFLFIPIIINIIPPIFRMYSLSGKKNKKYAYKFSVFIQYF